MSTRELIAAIRELDGYGIVQTDSDEELAEAIEQLALCEPEDGE